MKGPGTWLHDLILEFSGTEPTFSCKCKSWINKMNRGGVTWTRAHAGEIVEHLAREARAKGNVWRVTPLGKRFRVSIPMPSALLNLPGTSMFLVPFLSHLVNRACELTEQQE